MDRVLRNSLSFFLSFESHFWVLLGLEFELMRGFYGLGHKKNPFFLVIWISFLGLIGIVMWTCEGVLWLGSKKKKILSFLVIWIFISGSCLGCVWFHELGYHLDVDGFAFSTFFYFFIFIPWVFYFIFFFLPLKMHKWTHSHLVFSKKKKKKGKKKKMAICSDFRLVQSKYLYCLWFGLDLFAYAGIFIDGNCPFFLFLQWWVHFSI